MVVFRGGGAAHFGLIADAQVGGERPLTEALGDPVMLRFWLSAIAAVSVATCVAAQPLSRPGVDAPELARLGSHAVGLRSIILVDSAQPNVVARDATTGAPPVADRTLPVDIWYPAKTRSGAKPVSYADSLPGEPPQGPIRFTVKGLAVRAAAPDGGRYPLVIVSHGYSGTPVAMTWLTENLASKGYVVAAIHHNDPNISDPSKAGQPMLRRPLDIAFVAKALQARARAGGLANVDPDRVAVIGYSMGGYGALTVAGATLNPAGRAALAVSGGALKPYLRGGPKVADLRIAGLKAVVVMAPAGGGSGFNAWGAEGLADLTTPLLVIGGDRDRTVGYADGVRKVFEQAVHADRYLLVFQNGGHNIGMNGAPPEMRQQLWDQDWFEDPVWSKDRTAAIQQHMITAFLDLWVKGDASRAAYLATTDPISNDTKWPSSGPPGYTAISPGGIGATWKGFPRNHALGLELHHAAAAP